MQLMSIEDLAVYLGVSKRTIYKYLADGDCPPYIKLSTKNISFDRADVDAWLESKKVYPPDTTDGSQRLLVRRSRKRQRRQSIRTNCHGHHVQKPFSMPHVGEARQNGFAQVGTEHLLLGVLSVKECLGATILEHLGISQEECRHRYGQMTSTARGNRSAARSHSLRTSTK